MNYKQVIKRYGGPTKVAQVLGLKHKQTVHNWSAMGRIPSRWQIRLEALSGLKADRTAKREAAEFVAFVNGKGGNGHA